MSLEDISSEFLSDESECEAEDLSEGVNGDDEDASYQELDDLLNMLKSFDHIYINNAIMDEESTGSEAVGFLESDSVDSDLVINSIYEDMFSTNSSTSSSDASHEGLPSSDSEDSALRRIREFVLGIEYALSTSSSSLSTVSDGDGDEQPTNGHDANDLHEEVAESAL